MAPYTTLLGLAAVLAVPALAQTTVLNINVPVYAPSINVVASAISADATATEFVLGCANTSVICPIPTANKLKYGPRTVEHAMSTEIGMLPGETGPKTTMSNVVGCVVDGTNTVCSATLLSWVGTSTNTTTTSGPISTEMSKDIWVHAVTVTAGLENLTPKPTPPAQTSVVPGAAPRMTCGFHVMTAVVMVVVGGLVFA